MRRRILIRHFLWRFLEHDLVSPQTDRRGVLSAVAGLIVAFSLFSAVLIAWPYQLFPGMPAGSAALRSLDDRFLLISMSMLVMAMAAVAQWDALTLDARDTAVLGTLPLPHGMVVVSKLAATGLFALGVLVAWNAVPTVLRGAAVPAGLRLGWFATAELTLAHAVATSAAGLCAFLAVLCLRETACALLGGARFQKVSAALQGALLMLLITALLLLLRPGGTSHIAERRFARQDLAARLLPPLWFVGLHETLVGSVLDTVPRTRTAAYLTRRDDAATSLYRKLRRTFPGFARTGLVALGVVPGIAVAACLWNSRRRPSVSVVSTTRRGFASRVAEQCASRGVARTAVEQAGFFFTAQAVWRRPSHRLTMAAAVATALSLVIATGVGVGSGAGAVATVSVGMLATQTLVIAAVLFGFRHATRLPADLRGGITVALVWQGVATPYVTGVKRAGLVAVLGPTLLALWLWHVETLGFAIALRHLGVGAAVGGVMMETLFFRNRRVPLVSAYLPSPDATSRGWVTGVAILTASLALAAAEQKSLEDMRIYLGLVCTLLTIGVCLRRFDGVSPAAVVELEISEAESLPTLRLGLGG